MILPNFSSLRGVTTSVSFPEVSIRKETEIGLCFSHWSISLLDGYNSLRKLPGLLLALPRIHLLFFANMTAVMEEMSMDKEEKSFGPFFLEHFDNSDYGWGVTVRGEGVRHTQGCISCGPCSYPELTEDHVLPSA